MKRLLASTLVIFLVSVSFASALDFSLEMETHEQKTKPYTSAFFIAHVESSMREGGLYVFVEGDPAYWINMGTSYLDMPIPGPMDIEIEFYPNDKTGVYDYTVYVQSFLDKSLMVSEDITLVVLSGEKVDETGHSVTQNADSLTVDIDMVSFGEELVTVDYVLVNKEGLNSAVYTRSYLIKGDGGLTETIPLEDLIAGPYTLEVRVKETSIEFSEDITVEPVKKVVTSEDGSMGALFEERVISISNEGNVPEDGYTVTSTLPTGFVTFNQQPDRCENGECEWTLALEPWESTQITYRVEYWPLIAEGLLIAVLIVGFLIFGWNRLNVPSLNKKIEQKKDGTYTAMLEVKNAGKKISNVVVSDLVTPLFKVRHEFEAVKPAVRNTEEGTELIWTLPSIEPGDQRIMHYKIIPVVSGSLKVPRARMSYVSEKGKKVRVEAKGFKFAA